MRKVVTTVFFVLAGLGPCYCQTGIAEPGQPDPEAYRTFFSQAAVLQQSGPILVNDQYELYVTRPSLQQAIGLTDPEAAILIGIAKDCEIRLRELDGTPGLSKFESLLRSIESGETLAQLEQRIKELDARRDQVVRDHIQRLKAEIGESRFAVVEAFVRGKTSATDFFPMIGSPVLVPRK